MNVTTLEKIRALLNHHFKPTLLNVIDEGDQHIGHPGAKEGGHYAVEIISSSFQGKNLIERHRMIYQVLDELLKTKVHALKIQARTLTEK